METILSTTTEGQMRVDQATERFAHYAEAVRQLGEMEPRDIALRAKGGNLLDRPEAPVKQVAATAADRSCPPGVFHRHQLHLRQRSGAWNTRRPR